MDQLGQGPRLHWPSYYDDELDSNKICERERERDYCRVRIYFIFPLSRLKPSHHRGAIKEKNEQALYGGEGVGIGPFKLWPQTIIYSIVLHREGYWMLN